MIIFLHMSTACCSIPMHSASSRPDFKALSSDITPCLARNAVGFWCQRQYYVRANSPFKPYIYPTLRSVEPSKEQTQTLDRGSILVKNQCHFVNWTTFHIVNFTINSFYRPLVVDQYIRYVYKIPSVLKGMLWARSSTLLRTALNASSERMAAWLVSVEEFDDIHANTSGHVLPIVNFTDSQGVAGWNSKHGITAWVWL